MLLVRRRAASAFGVVVVSLPGVLDELFPSNAEHEAYHHHTNCAVSPKIKSLTRFLYRLWQTVRNLTFHS